MSSPEVANHLRIADEAYKMYEYAKALEGYKSALGVITNQSISPLTEKLRAEILLRIVDTLDSNGEWLDALMYVETIVNTARNKKKPKVEIEANLRAGRILTKRSSWKEAKKRYLHTLELGKKCNSTSTIAECHYGLAYLEWRLGNMDTAKINVEKTLKMVEKDEKLHHLKGQSLILLATIWDNIGETELSIEKFKEAISVLEKVDDLKELARAYNNLGEVYKGLEDYHTARVQYEKCVAVTRRSNDKHTEAYGLTNASECLAREGKLAEAETDIKMAEELLAAIDDPYASAYTHYVRGVIAHKKRNQRDACREYETTIEALGNLEATYDVGMVCFEYAKALQSFGQKETARKMYKKAIINLRKADANLYLKKAEAALKKLTGS